MKIIDVINSLFKKSGKRSPMKDEIDSLTGDKSTSYAEKMKDKLKKRQGEDWNRKTESPAK